MTSSQTLSTKFMRQNQGSPGSVWEERLLPLLQVLRVVSGEVSPQTGLVTRVPAPDGVTLSHKVPLAEKLEVSDRGCPKPTGVTHIRVPVPSGSCLS